MQHKTIDYISDLHADFYIKDNGSKSKYNEEVHSFVLKLIPKDKDGTPKPTSNILVVAGDISHHNKISVDVIKKLKEHYEHIIVVHGNHDMYMTSDAYRGKYLASLVKIGELADSLYDIPNVYYLDGDKVTLDGITFGGLCGWYDLPSKRDLDDWRFFMNDSNYIYDFPERNMYGTLIYNQWDTQNYYEEQYNKLFKLNDIDVLITHIAQAIPPELVINEQFRNDASNIFYYVDNIEQVKATGCSYYIYGHTHDLQEWFKEDIEFRCNPYGYPGESGKRKIKQLLVKV